MRPNRFFFIELPYAEWDHLMRLGIRTLREYASLIVRAEGTRP